VAATGFDQKPSRAPPSLSLRTHRGVAKHFTSLQDGISFVSADVAVVSEVPEDSHPNSPSQNRRTPNCQEYVHFGVRGTCEDINHLFQCDQCLILGDQRCVEADLGVKLCTRLRCYWFDHVS
jgi:hypothetical protein